MPKSNEEAKTEEDETEEEDSDEDLRLNQLKNKKRFL